MRSAVNSISISLYLKPVFSVQLRVHDRQQAWQDAEIHLNVRELTEISGPTLGFS